MLEDNSLANCCECGRGIHDRPTRCDVCGRAFCLVHQTKLALVKKPGPGLSVVRACSDCIKKNQLRVVDPNHPLYLNENTLKENPS